MAKRNANIKVRGYQGVPIEQSRVVSKDFLKHLAALQEGMIGYFIARAEDDTTTHRLQVSIQTTARRRNIAVRTRTMDDRHVMVMLHERDHNFREAMRRMYPFAGAADE